MHNLSLSGTIFISSQIGIETIANLLVNEGFRDAGYQYIILDDCWQDTVRDTAQRLQPDKNRFPNGMWLVADYVIFL